MSIIVPSHLAWHELYTWTSRFCTAIPPPKISMGYVLDPFSPLPTWKSIGVLILDGDVFASDLEWEMSAHSSVHFIMMVVNAPS